MMIANLVAFILVVIGAVNWGLIGIFNWNLVTAIFGAGMTIASSIIYILIFLAALWLVFYVIYNAVRNDGNSKINMNV